ncbi:HNH endonuclease family protein [Corynebacterium auriscanis]|uniref:HNH endonuclease family protein n=1 Tax=Corynebacterium auriscanis TaxID=99807 RepID=UPI003CEF2D5B
MRTSSSSSPFRRPRSGLVAAVAAVVIAGASLAGCAVDVGGIAGGGAATSASSLSTPPAAPSPDSPQGADSSGGGDADGGRGDGGERQGSSFPAQRPGAGKGGGGERRGGVDHKTGDAAEAVRLRGVLATLEVKGRAPKNNYRRTEFGQRWKDVDRNGCDQRNDVLARDLQQVEAPKGCKVLRGVLNDPYTGRMIEFQRGQSTSGAVQIDHVVALADAWQKGAQQWTAEQREVFGNDPQNLLAVDGPANMQKGAGDAATWLPKNKAFRCRYVSIQIEVKAKYRLWVTPAERDAMDRELGRCG